MFTQATNCSLTSAVAIREASSLDPAVLMISFSSDILLQSMVSAMSASAIGGVLARARNVPAS
jgi:hypothetical protein